MLDACSFCGVLGGQLPQRVTRSGPDVRLCWKLATGRFVTPTARRVACSLATLVSLDDDRLHLDADFIEDALPQDRAFARGKGLQSDQRPLRRRHRPVAKRRSGLSADGCEFPSCSVAQLVFPGVKGTPSSRQG